MIPKKIHYIWFGKGPKNKIFEKCYNSWKKFLPEYEIIEWNEDNFDLNSNEYIKEAYKVKKYAFVSDYVRLKVLYDHGGIYFDTDVEVLKKIPKDILSNGYFAKEIDTLISTGLGFCVPKHSKIIKYMLDDYEKIHFINKDGTYDLTPCPYRNTESLTKRNYKVTNNNEDLDGIKVYDRDYFCGYDIDNHRFIVSDKTYTVHHYDASWMNSKTRLKRKFKFIISALVGKKNYGYLRKIKKIINKDIKNGDIRG